MTEFKKPIGKPTYGKEESQKKDDDVMEEEEYLEEMAKIIRRDFFPEKMSQEDMDEIMESEKNGSIKMNLNQFIRKVKSEDNETFKQIMQLEEEKWKQKYWWMFLAEKKDRINQLALGNGENLEQDNIKRMILPHPDKRIAITDVEAHSGMFFMPPNLTKKQIDLNNSSSSKIVYENTRFDSQQIEADQTQSAKKMVHQIAQDNDARMLSTPFLLGMLDQDDTTNTNSKRPFKYNLEELMHGRNSSDSIKAPPIINGYQMHVMPSPAPSSMPSPLITWGQIEGEPTKITENKSFKIRDVSEREKVANNITNNIQKSKAIQKKVNQEIMKKVVSSGTPHKVAAILSSAQGNSLIKSIIAKKLTSQRVAQLNSKTPHTAKAPISTPSLHFNAQTSSKTKQTISSEQAQIKQNSSDDTPLLNF